MVASQKPILLIGMSHITAVRNAMREDERRIVESINLNERSDIFDERRNHLNLDYFRNYGPQVVLLSIRGNFHNVFGLIENPIPLAIGDSVFGAVPPVRSDEDRMRHFVPEGVARAFFSAKLNERAFVHLKPLVERFSEAKFFHLCSPPPSGDADHISAFPGVFRSKIGLGVSPPALRRKLYDIHTDLFRQACLAQGISFVEVPDGVVDEDGIMLREFWNRDATHGNEAYGRRVLDQVRQMIEVFS